MSFLNSRLVPVKLPILIIQSEKKARTIRITWCQHENFQIPPRHHALENYENLPITNNIVVNPKWSHVDKTTSKPDSKQKRTTSVGKLASTKSLLWLVILVKCTTKVFLWLLFATNQRQFKPRSQGLSSSRPQREILKTRFSSLSQVGDKPEEGLHWCLTFFSNNLPVWGYWIPLLLYHQPCLPLLPLQLVAALSVCGLTPGSLRLSFHLHWLAGWPITTANRKNRFALKVGSVEGYKTVARTQVK